MTEGGAQASSAEKQTEIIQVTDAQIRNMIYTVRGEQVMLDRDLAELYGVETRILNQAVTRNPSRFPRNFCFRLNREDLADLTSQIVMFNPDLQKQAKTWTHPPRVFTEQGVSMLSAVLRSDTAIDMSVRIMNTFVEMRHFIADNAAMFEQIRDMRHVQWEYQKATDRHLENIDHNLERIFDYMDAHEEPIQRVFFDGQVWDAFELLTSLVLRAKREIVLVDGYVDTGTLNVLAKKHSDVRVTIWTHPKTRLTQRDVDTFNAQYPKLEVRHTDTFHDRFLILDGTEAYLVGASLKDAGKKTFGIARIEDEKIVRSILERLNKEAR